ncbi:hypothetical protein E7V67_011560 [[Empedobacter] haloabium]|uniref:Uncharacterized protein n=1 Tax=[Empedobacter] haloabium TaxID=592317 RepID=A0ABZ1UUS6_9BURK
MAKAKTEAQAPDVVDETLATAGADLAPVQSETPAPVPEVPAGPQLVRARVLCACDLGAPNDVVDVPAQLVQDRPDVLDADASAVAYALSQAY